MLLRIQMLPVSNHLQLLREQAVFMNLSANGYGPKLLAVFAEGRIEEYIPSRAPRKDEFLREGFFYTIAGLVAKINNTVMPLPKFPQYIPLLRSWLLRCRVSGLQPMLLERTAVHGAIDCPEVLSMELLEKEIAEIEGFLSEQESPSVFCHNDMVASNVLLRDTDQSFTDDDSVVERERLVLIDFGFAFYNYRAYEIANTMAECGMSYDTPEYPYYSVDLDMMENDSLFRTFCSGYLDQLYEDMDSPEKMRRQLLTGDRRRDLNMLINEGRRFLPLPHFFWATWNIFCSQVQGLGDALEGADFLTHAKDRLIVYYHFKDNMYKY